jgi:hypothetical protein
MAWIVYFCGPFWSLHRYNCSRCHSGAQARIFDPAKFKKEEDQNKLPESLVIDKEKSDEESKDPGSDQPAKESALTKTLGGFAAVFKDKCCFWVMLGNCCRFWEYYTVTNYSLQYFNLFGKPNLYAGLNALALLIGGVGSNFATGYICDKYELVNFRTKSYVMALESLIAVPLFAIIYLNTQSFALSMTMQAIEYLVCEGFTPPALSMLLTCIDVKYKGVGVGVLTFTYTIAGTIATIVDGFMISAFGDDPK